VCVANEVGRPPALDATLQIQEDDDEFSLYRKRMMLAYRFRPNPLVCNAALALARKKRACPFEVMALNRLADVVGFVDWGGGGV
jgi:hypothetical protein